MGGEHGEQGSDDHRKVDVDPQALAHLLEKEQMMRDIESHQGPQASRLRPEIERLDGGGQPKVLLAALIPKRRGFR